MLPEARRRWCRGRTSERGAAYSRHGPFGNGYQRRQPCGPPRITPEAVATPHHAPPLVRTQSTNRRIHRRNTVAISLDFGFVRHPRAGYRGRVTRRYASTTLRGSDLLACRWTSKGDNSAERPPREAFQPRRGGLGQRSARSDGPARSAERCARGRRERARSVGVGAAPTSSRRLVAWDAVGATTLRLSGAGCNGTGVVARVEGWGL